MEKEIDRFIVTLRRKKVSRITTSFPYSDRSPDFFQLGFPPRKRSKIRIRSDSSTSPLISGSGRGKDALAASSLRVELIALKIFFRYLASKGKVDEDVADQIDSPKLEQYLPETLNEPTVKRLLESIDDARPLARRDRAGLELLYASGLRFSELTGARLENLFLEDGAIRVTGRGIKRESYR